ncbi:glycosyltransferase [Pseudomonas sp. JV241A]|uniref:glycosyltransferase n=1 Tax=Pseudomonas sp. JV241A TaxID=2078785 RepID=UPI00100D8792|nr:glycosyltransferase [Pseudomonas sp. JV241A]SPO65735.1 Glycosyl transferase family 1 [Pseudomonas sp. JV241A]
MPIKVLYIDGDGPMGGASRSLYEVVSRFPADTVSSYFVASSGTATNFYKRVAVDLVETRGMSKFDNTRYGYYRGGRWLILLREFFYFPFMLVALLRAKKKWRSVDVIHVNEYVYILPALIAKLLFRAPLVVHVRALARVQADSRRVRLLNFVFSRWVDAIVAIDGNVRVTLPATLPVHIVNNSFSPSASNAPTAEFVKKFDGLRNNTLKVGFVGNLHLSKGVLEIAQAAKILRDEGYQIDFVMVGGGTLEDKGAKAWLLAKFGFAQNFGSELQSLLERDQMDECFHLFGPTLDIKYVYDRIDVLLFPSHFDAPGRPVFEAGFSSVPSIVAVENPSADTFVPNHTGLAIKARDANALAEAIAYFNDNPEERKRMGDNARQLALQNFTPETNAKKLLDIYSDLVVSR